MVAPEPRARYLNLAHHELEGELIIIIVIIIVIIIILVIIIVIIIITVVIIYYCPHAGYTIHTVVALAHADLIPLEHQAVLNSDSQCNNEVSELKQACWD